MLIGSIAHSVSDIRQWSMGGVALYWLFKSNILFYIWDLCAAKVFDWYNFLE